MTVGVACDGFAIVPREIAEGRIINRAEASSHLRRMTSPTVPGRKMRNSQALIALKLCTRMPAVQSLGLACFAYSLDWGDAEAV